MQELGSKTPKELTVLLDPNSSVHADELGKIRRQELFAQYMATRLGIDFKYTTPIDKYPVIYVQIVIGVHKSHVRLEVTLPRSVALYIRHEGALREDSNRKFGLTGDEVKQFMALCVIWGKDPQEVWSRIKGDVLGSGIDPEDISVHRSQLHDVGLYEDELITITDEETEDV